MLWLRMALRNLGRNKRRSALAASMVAVGTGLVVFSWGFEDGAEAGSIEATTNLFVGQVHITTEEYPDKPRVQDTVPGLKGVLETVYREPGVVAATPRAEALGLVFGPDKSLGMKLVGVEVASETLTTLLHTKVVEGRFVSDRDPEGAAIGERASEILGVSSGDTAVFISQAADGSVAVGRFVIRGILRTGSRDMDSRLLIVPIEGARQALFVSGAHEVVAKTGDVYAAEAVAQSLKRSLPDLRVESWEDYMRVLKQTTDMMRAFMEFIMFLLALLAIAGISNTLLMSVSERTREFGVLMALGARRRGVFVSVAWESAVLALAGVVAGLLVGAAITWALGRVGIDLSAWARGAEAVGWPAVIHPRMGPLFLREALITCAAFTISAIISALFPAWGAARLEPAGAMRHK